MYKTINNVVNGQNEWILAIEYGPTPIEKWLIFSDKNGNIHTYVAPLFTTNYKFSLPSNRE